MLRARLRGGLLNKAQRGELRCPLPVGLLHAPDGQVVLDPDQQVQDSVRLLFDTFLRTASVRSTVQHFRHHGLLFPTRWASGAQQGQLGWGPLSIHRAARALHHPWYAGAYTYGRSRHRKQIDGRMHVERLPPSEWHTLIKEHHPGYLSWEQHERIQECLRENTRTLPWGPDHSLPREGPALLQGRAVGGLCGSRMHVRYTTRVGQPLVPAYVCVGRSCDFGDPTCQSITGTELDAAVGQLLVEAVTPMALELTLAMQQELNERLDQADRLRHRQVERAQYEADQARHRYLQVDPANRLVADSLEADWNDKLRALQAAQTAYEHQREADRLTVDEAARQRVLSLATDFPAVWNDPNTPPRERKRMLALLIEDVTLIKQRHLTAAVRFRGGATTTLTLPRPLTAQQRRATHDDVRRQIDTLLDEYTDAQVAHQLNQRGLRTGAGDAFDSASVQWVRHAHQLKSLKQRLLDDGWLTGHQVQQRLGVKRATLSRWRHSGQITERIGNDLGEWLYWLPPDQQNPGDTPPTPPKGNSTAGGAA